MAIQHRQGDYAYFDPAKMLPGELAVVKTGDPAASSGRSIYVCFQAGVVKRLTTYEDFEREFNAVSDGVKAELLVEMNAAISAANKAASAANTSKTSADAAAKRANDAAAACEGLTDNKRVTALETQMADVIAALSNTLATE